MYNTIYLYECFTWLSVQKYNKCCRNYHGDTLYSITCTSFLSTLERRKPYWCSFTNVSLELQYFGPMFGSVFT